MSIKDIRNRRGVTLVELLVVISILTIVIGLIYGIFISQMRSKFWQDQIVTMAQEMRTGTDMLVNELRIANEVTRNIGGNYYSGSTYNYNGINYTISGDISNTIVLFTAQADADPWDDWVLYVYNATVKQLLRKSGNIGASAPLNDPNATEAVNPFQVIAEGITNATFIYYDASDSPMNYDTYNKTFRALDQNALGDIRRIKISVTSETEKANPETGNKLNRTLETSIKLRGEKTWKVSGAGCGILEMSIVDVDTGIDKIDIAFCDNEKANIFVKLWDLEGHRVGYDYTCTDCPNYATSSLVRVFPKGGEPLIFWPSEWINASTSAGTTRIENSGIKTAGVAIEVLGSWKPPSPCTYDILTSRTIVVKAGKPWKIAMMNATSASLKGCSTGCPSQISTIKAQVTDACANPIKDFTLNFAITNAGSFSSSSLVASTTAPLTDSNGYTTVIYYAPDTFTSLTNPAIVTVTDPNDGDVNKDLNSTEPTDKTKTVTISLSPCDAKYLIEDSSPFNITTTECPNKTFALNFKVTDACGNPREDEFPNLSATLLPNRGSVSLSSAGDLYTVTYTTPSACGDGNVDTDITLTHSTPAVANTLSAGVAFDQCPMPGLDLTIISPVPSPKSEVVPCYQSPATIRATLRGPHADNCSAWNDVTAEYTFENINKTQGEFDPDIGGFSIDNSSPSTTDSPDITITSTDGIAQVYLFGKNDTNKASIGDELKVRAKVKIKYDPVSGLYGTEYKDLYYNDLINNLLDVIAPTVEVKFMDSSYANEARFYDVPAKVPAEGTGTIYLQVSDCDANEDSLISESLDVTLKSDDITGIINTMTVSLTEAGGSNTGVFQKAVDMKRSPTTGYLYVDKGGRITAEYTDISTSLVTSKTIYLSGCREMTATRSGLGINTVTPDVAPYDPTYPDGVSAFHVTANLPFYANDSTSSSITGHACTGSGSDDDTITAAEEGDTGLFKIGGASDLYIYVGEGISHPQADGEDGSRSIRMSYSPDNITMIGPDVSTTCDRNHNDVVNYGCYTVVYADDVDAPSVVSLSLPTDRTLLSGATIIEYSANDGTGLIDRIRLYRQLMTDSTCGVSVGGSVLHATYLVSPNSSNVPLTQQTVDFSSVSEGWHQLYVTAVDTKSNIGTSNTKCTVRDTTLPTVTLSSPANRTAIQGTTLSYTFTATDAASGIASATVYLVDVDSGAISTQDYVFLNQSSVTQSGSFMPGYGQYYIYVTVRDAAGYTKTSSQSHVTLTTLPSNCVDFISVGETVAGTITTACSSVHRPPYYARYYSFAINAVTGLTIRLTRALPIDDPYLFLLDSNGNILCYDDDTGTNFNSLLPSGYSGLPGCDTLIMPAGSYIIEATTYSSDSIPGNFTLQLQ